MENIRFFLFVPKKRLIYLLGLVILIGFSLRIFKLGTHDLWYDEVICVWVGENLNHIYTGRHPPLFVILLQAWTTYFGKSEFALRFLSVIFSVLSIYAIYKLGNLLFDKKTGLVGAVILSISPIHIWYSQEVKGYTLLPFLIITAVYFYIKAFREDKVAFFWAGFILISTLSIYTNYIAFFILPAGSLLLFLKRYRFLVKKWFIACSFILIFFLPWLPIFLKHVQGVRGIFWVPKPSFRSMLITFENFNVGYNATYLIYKFSMVIFLILFFYGIFRYLREREKILPLLFFLFIPIILSFLISQWMPIYIDRHLIAFSPFYYLIVAAGIVAIGNRLVKGLACILLTLVMATSLYNYYSDHVFLPEHNIGVFIKQPFKPAVEYIKQHYEKGDIFTHSNVGTIMPFVWYSTRFGGLRANYFDSEPQRFIFIPEALDEYWLRASEFIMENLPDTIDLSQDDIIKNLSFKRIWFIQASWARDGNLDRDSLAVKEWMETHLELLCDKEMDGLLISLFQRKKDLQ